MTIYAPALNKQQNTDVRNMDTINQISSFVERLRVQSEGNGSPGTSTGRRTEQGRRRTPEPEPQSTPEKDDFTSQMIINA